MKGYAVIVVEQVIYKDDAKKFLMYDDILHHCCVHRSRVSVTVDTINASKAANDATP